MIRYRCGNCGQKIRSRPDFAGKRMRCPHCSFADRVPLHSTFPESALASGKRSALPEERDSILDESPLSAPAPEEARESIFDSPPTERPTPRDSRFRYRCPHCSQLLLASSTASGKICRCPRCYRTATVPSPFAGPDSTPTVARPEPACIDFRCPFCTHAWRGPRPEGEECHCSRCENPFPVPDPVPAPDSAAAFAPPGYELIGELGRGAFGVVYVGRHLELNRVVALKVMRPDVDPELMPRFRAEAQAVARMQHPNIVQIFEVGEHQGRFFCALEYVDGGSLQEMLRGQSLPASQAAKLVEELAVAMHYAHQQGVVHRDLKPANVLLSRRATTPANAPADASVALTAGTLKITDFGLAKRLDDDSTQTKAGTFMGTPSYVSPEQAQGKEVDPAADVYSLGAVLYEMLTGKPPFVGKNVFDTLHRVCYHEPVPPRQLDRKIPRDLETICLKCLEKNPARRYASALDLAADLGRFRAGDSILARPASAPTRLVKAVRRRPAAAVAVALLLLAVFALGWGLRHRRLAEESRLQAQSARQAEEERLERERDAKRLKVAYFATYVNRRGVLEGVCPITQEEARRRSFSFKFYTRGGRVEKVEAVNGRGAMTTSHQVESLIDDDSNPNKAVRECRWEFRYKDNGEIAREVAYDRNGLVVWSFSHQSDQSGYFEDSKGYARSRSGSGAAFVEFVRDDNGFFREIRFFDERGRPRPSTSRVFGRRLVTDRRGLPVEEIHLGQDGKPATSTEGYARAKFAYDERGNRTQVSFFDALGKPCWIKYGLSRMTFEYDAWGNCTKLAFFGTDGNPCLSTFGYAGWAARYDEHGNQTETISLGVDGKPCKNKDGAARLVRKFDERGNVVEEAHFGTDGRLCMTAPGFARYTASYDERGNRNEMAFFDVEGKPCLHVAGMHRFVARHDERGNRIEIAYFGIDGKPRLSTEGYARLTDRHDERGNLREEAYFGIDGKPCRSDKGFAVCVAEHDDRGNRTKESYFGPDGKPCPHKDGYASWAAKYDERGNQSELAYYDVNGKPCLHSDGNARLTARYDDRGNRIEQAYFGVDGKPCRLNNGFAASAAEYDDRGNCTKESYFGPDGKPCLHKDGYASWAAKYDERGNCVERAHFSVDGSPCACEDGSHGFTARYDNRGNRTEISHFGVDRQPCRTKYGFVRFEVDYGPKNEVLECRGHGCDPSNGFASQVAKFDGRGLIREVAYFDAQGKPCLHNDGFHRSTCRHDERGNRIEQAYFGVDGKLVATKAGYARMEQTFDAQDVAIDATYFGVNEKPVAVAVVIVAVAADGQGQRLGLQVGDVLVRYDGKEVKNVPSFTSGRLREQEQDEPRELIVQRKGEQIKVMISPGLPGVDFQDQVINR